jgi:hypothetical protein
VTARELPRREWHRLPDGCELASLAATLPESVQIVVVEDADGRIVGAWSAMFVAHVEGVWIDEAHRARGAVARRLLQGMRSVLLNQGVSAALTGGDQAIVELLEKLGAQPLPFPLYVWHAKGRILSE